MVVYSAAPLSHRRGTRLAIFLAAGLVAHVLSVAAGHSEAAGLPSNTVAIASSGPYPDPGNDLTDPGIPGNPPPPVGGIEAPGPGSPDSGLTLPSAGPPQFYCQLTRNQDQQECFRPTEPEQYTVCAFPPYTYAFKLVETAVSDGTLLRTWRFAPKGCQRLSFLRDTLVTMVNDSPYPRYNDTNLIGSDPSATDDFLCQVPIHNPYEPRGWQNQAKCTWTGGNSWLAKFTNFGDRPVDMAEWYRGSYHGRTELRPGEAKVLPLHSYGEFYVGAGGPAGRPIKIAITDYHIANELKEMWVRDKSQSPIGSAGNVAVNLSPYTVHLRWTEPPPGSLDLAPFGRVQLPGVHLFYGEKSYGNGEVARVLFIKPESGGGDYYSFATPPPNDEDYPYALVTWLFNTYSSVKIENVGPWPVGLISWFIPHLIPIGEVDLERGQSAILPLVDRRSGIAATEISGIVFPPHPGRTGRVKATEWAACLDESCGTRFDPTLNMLSGAATGLAEGQVQLRLQGRITLAPSAGALSLGRASVDLTSLLNEGLPAGQLAVGATGESELGAAGELVEVLGPYGTQLTGVGRSGPTTLFTEKPPLGAPPVFRMQVTPRGSRVFDFTLSVAKSALSGEPQLCSAGQPSVTGLATRFFIYNNQGRPVDVATTQPWQCVGSNPQDPSALLLQ
ncbi:MAG TPA: hypothetical protein VL985_00585 [Stellaceae bacterium]|nr:hypothetical protein [Stellaceae bacterium]